MKKKNIIKIAIAVVVVAVVGGGVLCYHSSTVSAANAKNAAKYVAVKAKTGTLAVTVQSTGAASAATSDVITSSNNGIISSVNVKEGETIKKGQTIGFINDTTLQQSVNLAQLKVQQDNIADANNKTTLQQSVNLAQLKVTQDNTTIAGNTDSQKVASNSDQLAQDQADLSSKTTQLNEISTDIQLVQDQTDLSNKTAQLAEETVTSPINGVIVTLNYQNGDTVKSGKPIATISDMSSLEIIAQVDELDISKVANGQKASITFDALTGKTYTGTVTKVSPLGTTKSDVTDYAVDIAIDNPTGIKIGMNGNLNIITASKSNVVTLSLDAIQTLHGKSYVLTSIPKLTSGSNSSSKKNSRSSSGGSATGTGGGKGMKSSGMIEITTGLTNQTDAEITSGLKDGDTAYIKLPTVSTSTTSNTSKISKISKISKTSKTSGASSSGGGSGSGAARGGK